MLHPQLIANGIILAPIYALFSLAFILQLKTANYWALSLASSAVLSAYIGFSLHQFGLPLIIASLSALLFAAIFGGLLEFSIYERLRVWEAPASISIVVGIGINIFVESALSIIYGDRPIVFIQDPATLNLFSSSVFLTTSQLIGFVSAILYLGIVFFVLTRSPYGLWRKALESRVELSRFRHIPIGFIFLVGAAISYVLAGASGVLIAMELHLYPQLGIDMLLLSMLIGVSVNRVSVHQILLTAFILSIAFQYATQLVPGEWRQTLVLSVLLIVLLLRSENLKVRDA